MAASAILLAVKGAPLRWQGLCNLLSLSQYYITAAVGRHIRRLNLEAQGAELHEAGIPESRSNRTRFIIVAVVVVLALAFMIWAAFGENTRYFLTVSEFNSKTEIHDGQMVRVLGKLVEGTFDRGEKSTLSHFQLTDKEGESSGTSVLLASYDGVLPDLFFNPHSEIILEGSYSGDGTFHASEILVKCPSKYRDLEDQLEDQLEYGATT